MGAQTAALAVTCSLVSHPHPDPHQLGAPRGERGSPRALLGPRHPEPHVAPRRCLISVQQTLLRLRGDCTSSAPRVPRPPPAGARLRGTPVDLMRETPRRVGVRPAGEPAKGPARHSPPSASSARSPRPLHRRRPWGSVRPPVKVVQSPGPLHGEH